MRSISLYEIIAFDSTSLIQIGFNSITLHLNDKNFNSVNGFARQHFISKYWNAIANSTELECKEFCSICVWLANNDIQFVFVFRSIFYSNFNLFPSKIAKPSSCFARSPFEFIILSRFESGTNYT